MALKIAILGNGNLAFHLAKRLFESDNPAVALILRDLKNSEAFTPFLDNAAIITRDFNLQSYDWDLVIIAVSDRAIREIIAKINFPENAVVVHTSGSESLEIFQDSEIKKFGVIYPLQTLSKEKNISFESIPIFIEATNHEASKQILVAANLLSNRVSELGSEKRLRLHMSAVIACNFTNALYGIAEKELKEIGLDLSIISPLIYETVEKAISIGPEKAATGPAIRGDKNIIDKHLALLSNSPDLESLYRQLTKLIENSKSQK